MTRKIASTFVALIAAVALLSGCGAASPIATAEIYSASDGVRLDFSNGVRVENLFFLTAEPGAAVRPMGAIVNDSNEPAEITIEVAGHVATYAVDAKSLLNLEADGGIYEGIELTPGTNTPATIISGGPASYDIPVLDGTIPPYEDFLP